MKHFGIIVKHSEISSDCIVKHSETMGFSKFIVIFGMGDSQVTADIFGHDFYLINGENGQFWKFHYEMDIPIILCGLLA